MSIMKMKDMKMKDMKIKKKTNPINLLSNIDFSHKRFSSLFPSPRFKLNFQNKITATKLAANKITVVKLAASKITATKLAASKITASIMAASKMTVIKLSPNKLSADQLAMSKLAISFAFLLLLAACGGDTGGTGDNKPPKGDKGETPEVNKCAKEPIPKGCPGYEPINSYLDDAIDSTELDSYIIGQSIKNLFTVTDGKYGTIAIPKNKTSFTADYFKGANIFTEATGDAIKDNTKNNIIKITGNKSSSNLETNYYYSHIDGKHFTRFLPAIHKLQILGLGAKLVTQDNVPSATGGLIFDDSYWNLSGAYQRLKGLVVKATNYTFKGFALARFGNNTDKYFFEENFYTGKFILTFNSTGFGESYDSDVAQTYDFFSMKITLDQKVAAQTNWPNANEGDDPYPDLTNAVIVDSVNKPAVKTIEIKDFNFLPYGTYKTYSEGSGIPWNYTAGALLAFNQTKSGEIDQIAGRINLRRQPNNDGNFQYLHTTFASNEFCNSEESSCERVKLAD